MQYMGGIENTLRDIAKNGGCNEPRATLLTDAADRITELEAALLAVIHAYDDDDAPDPERSLSDAIQAARAVWRGGASQELDHDGPA